MPKRVTSIRPPPRDERPKNKLLARLPPADFARIRPHLRTIPVTARQVLHPRNAPLQEVFFPNGGVASVTAVMRDGSMVEIATIGDEGLVGMDAFFGGTQISGESMIQVPDTNRRSDDGSSPSRKNSTVGVRSTTQSSCIRRVCCC